MSEFETFSEWMKRKTDHAGHRPVPAKNPNIDSFLAAVDNLKRDMEELDSVEKKDKMKPKKVKLDDKKKEDDKKKPDKKRDEDEVDLDGEDDDVLDDVDLDRSGKPLRLPPDRKVPKLPERTGRKPGRPLDFGDEQLERR